MLHALFIISLYVLTILPALGQPLGTFGNFSSNSVFVPSPSTYTDYVVTADVNGDGVQDALFNSGVLSTGFVVVLGSVSGGQWSAASYVTVPFPSGLVADSFISFDFQDIDQDGYLDIFAVYMLSNRMIWFRNLGTSLVSFDSTIRKVNPTQTITLTNHGSNMNPTALALVNPDNYPDVVATITNGTWTSVVVYFNPGANVTTVTTDWPSTTIYSVSDSYADLIIQSKFLTDVNGDKVLDLFFLASDSGSQALYFMPGVAGPSNVSFPSPPTVISFPSFQLGTQQSFAMADLNQDGLMDLVACDSNGNAYYWLHNSVGFSAPILIDISMLDSCVYITSADLDLNGWPDLIWALSTTVWFAINKLQSLSSPTNANTGFVTYNQPLNNGITTSTNVASNQFVVTDLNQDFAPDMLIVASSNPPQVAFNDLTSNKTVFNGPVVPIFFEIQANYRQSFSRNCKIYDPVSLLPSYGTLISVSGLILDQTNLCCKNVGVQQTGNCVRNRCQGPELFVDYIATAGDGSLCFTTCYTEGPIDSGAESIQVYKGVIYTGPSELVANSTSKAYIVLPDGSINIGDVVQYNSKTYACLLRGLYAIGVTNPGLGGICNIQPCKTTIKATATQNFFSTGTGADSVCYTECFAL